MKTKLSRRNLNRKGSVTCIIGLACLALPGVCAQEAESGEDAELRNWVDVTVGGNLFSGDQGASQRRTQLPRDAFGGVTDFHYEMDVGKRALFEVDGRGIFDAHNYSLSLSLKDPNIGYVKAGFEEFLSYYDTSGGYFPGNGQFFELYPTVWELDRSKVFFEAGLTLENKPEVRVRYEYNGRDGEKNSTVWGDTTLTGSGTRKIVPAFSAINEDRHTIALDVSHAIGKTTAGVGGRYEFSSYDNARHMRRAPTEASDRFLTHREGADTDLFNARAFTDTDLTEEVKLTTAYSYTKFDTDIFGSRATGSSFNYDPSPASLAALPAATRINRDHGFFGLGGGTDVHQHVGTISLMYRPTQRLTIVPTLRFESQDQSGVANFTDTEINAAKAVVTEAVQNLRTRDLLEVTERLEARYTGVTNWVFFARGELTQGEGRLSESEKFVDEIPYQINRTSDSTRFTQKYTAGATWYPHRRVNMSAQYYHRVRENDYDHTDLSPAGAGLYPAFIENQQITTDDANFRVTYRPINSVTLVSRYDFQYSTIDSQMQTLAEIQSGRSVAHIISESITWIPMPRLYLQASGSYTLDRLDSPPNETAPALLQVAENNYYTVTGTIGYALTQQTDLTANYSYYRADNYEPWNLAAGMPFGAGLEEHLIGGSVVHRFSKRMVLTTRYGFITSHDETSGGFNDFDAHLFSSTLRYRF